MDRPLTSTRERSSATKRTHLVLATTVGAGRTSAERDGLVGVASVVS